MNHNFIVIDYRGKCYKRRSLKGIMKYVAPMFDFYKNVNIVRMSVREGRKYESKL